MKFKKILIISSLIGKYDVIIVILMSCQLKKWKVSIVSLFWIFGVRDNFRLLISYLNPETQYQFEILRKCHFSSLRSLFLSAAFPHELATMTIINDLFSILQFQKLFYGCSSCPAFSQFDWLIIGQDRWIQLLSKTEKVR